MPPDAAWPNLPSYHSFTAEDHAAHTSPKGIPYPENLVLGLDARKSAKGLMKAASKPHLKLSQPKSNTMKRRKMKKRKY
jgi:hypothetical protein